MKKLLLFSALLILTSCKSNSGPVASDFDFCHYATKNSDYSFFFKGDVIEKCTVLEPKTTNSEDAGYKSVGHTAKLELSIKNSSGEVRVNKRWIQIIRGDGDSKFSVIQNKTIQ